MKEESKDINVQNENKNLSSNHSFWKVGIILLLLSILISIIGIKKSEIKERIIDLVQDQHCVYDENNSNLVHWKFTLNISSIEEFNSSQISSKSKHIVIPHTWNNMDGQDGGGNYLRTISAYQTQFQINETILAQKKRIFIEFGAVSLVATVYLNGHYIGNHVGGFQIFRFDLTDYIQKDENILTVFADNRQSTSYYPQFADFTFFGGIYRPVKLIFKSNEAHFNMNDFGSPGIYVTPQIIDNQLGIINVRPLITIYNDNHNDEYSFKYIIYDQQGQIVQEVVKNQNDTNFNITIENYIQWNGRLNPYLYTLEGIITKSDIVIEKSDQIRFGFRTFSCNHSGFYLNGNRMKLRGVSRHQDRLNKGWAVAETDEIEDIELITEMGANSVRFAHYQQSQKMFDLCDEKGLIVWVEIPFISMFLNTSKSNINLEQILTELIKQNYNHACVSMWGLANEIGIGGESTELFNVLSKLNTLSKSLDPTRMTTAAIFQGTQYDSPLNRFTDIFGYNLYYGWYSGEVNDNDHVIDEIHKVSSNPPLAITEYGAECNIKFHSEEPKVQDYSEEYQLFYHSKVYSIIQSKEFIWGSFVWNMFDFAADSRNEGGVQGRNNKGLVTYDRKIKKDSFYYYKACWTSSPFIHICSKRFIERYKDTINVSILSNIESVTVYLNGEVVKTFNGDFNVMETVTVKLNDGLNKIKVVSNSDGQIFDLTEFKKVKKENKSYELIKDEDEDEKAFTKVEGFLSVYDTVGEVVKHKEALELIQKYYGKKIPSSALMMVKSMKIIRVIRMAGASVFPPERIKDINDVLNKIPKNK